MKSEKLGTEHPLKLLIEFSIPAIIGMLVIAIYNIVDRIFIGNDPQTGALGLAAITITYPVTLVTIAICLLVSVGGATRFSIALGEKKHADAGRYMGNALFLGLLFAAIFTVFGNLFIEPLLLFLGASQNVLPFAEEYLQIILYGTVFQVISMFGNNFSRAQGNPKNAMVSQLIGAGFNIVFDYLLIIKLGWGMKGAALATIGGMFLSSLWQLFFLCGKRIAIPLRIKQLLPSFVIIKGIIITGLPIFFTQMANSILTIILNGSLTVYGGDIAISATGIISSFANLLLMPISGLIQGQQPIISYNFGFKRLDRARQTLKYAAIAATIVGILGFLLVQFFTVGIVTLFTKDQQVVKMAAWGLRIWFIALPLIGGQIIFASYFQAIGQAKVASFLSLSRQIIFLIPLILLMSSIWGLSGIFYAVPLADLLAFILTTFFITRELRRTSSVGL